MCNLHFAGAVSQVPRSLHDKHIFLICVYTPVILFCLQALQPCPWHAHESVALSAVKKSSLQVRDALAKKVSRERMGVELEKMFTGEGLELCLPL